MGMFDNIRVEAEIPGGFVGEPNFQTKSLDCLLDNYKITSDSKLVRDVTRWESDDSAPMGGHISSTGQWEEIPYHGVINFYTSDDYDRWREYYAFFTDGQLTRIEIDPISEDTSRKYLAHQVRQGLTTVGNNAEALEALESMEELLKMYDRAVIDAGWMLTTLSTPREDQFKQRAVDKLPAWQDLAKRIREKIGHRR